MTNDRDAPLVVVTGADGNLGAAVLGQLESSHARIVAIERTRVRHGERIFGDLDILRADSVEAMFGQVHDALGPIDGVIHTVGMYRGGHRLLDTPTDDFDLLFKVNALATANVLRAALSVMLPERRGRIAVVSSTDAISGGANQSAYAASKAAQLRLIESVAAEVRGSGIGINAVLPTTMDTPQNRAAMPNADRSSWLSLESVARVLVFLVSPSAAAIHGQAIQLGI
ncbi:MAG TPA: SDR family oxidoreductase [Polyangiales bacterium]|nr:SDR family oxidoreductase [Polyangiales bacterium]